MQKKSFWLERIAKNIEFLDNFTRINTDKVNFNSIYSIFANQKYLRIKGTIFSTDESPFISKSLDTFLKLGFNERAVLGLDLFSGRWFCSLQKYFPWHLFFKLYTGQKVLNCLVLYPTPSKLCVRALDERVCHFRMWNHTLKFIIFQKINPKIYRNSKSRRFSD